MIQEDKQIHESIINFNVEERINNIDYSKTMSLEQLNKIVKKLTMMNALQISMISSPAQKIFLSRDNAMREGKFNGVNYAIRKIKQLINYANKNFSSTDEVFEKLANIITQSKNEYLNFKANDNKLKTIREFNDLQTRISILLYLWKEFEGRNKND